MTLPIARQLDRSLPLSLSLSSLCAHHHRASYFQKGAYCLGHDPSMSTVFCVGRLCLRHSQQRFTGTAFKQGTRFFVSTRPTPSYQYKHFKWPFVKPPPPRFGSKVLVSAAGLTPAAFVLLGQQDNDDGKTGEEHMLEASRAEIDDYVPEFLENKTGLIKIYRFIDKWIVEPIATGFRFLHLVIIFVPLILTIPVIFIGARKKDRDNERSGTLWWYGFLVGSMERAGAAFIKVGILGTHGTRDWI